MEQGSYMLIEPGMTVRGTDETIGTVSEVVADKSVDIFRGLLVTHGFVLHKTVFVAAEYVSAVEGDTVTLTLSKADADALPETDNF